MSNMEDMEEVRAAWNKNKTKQFYAAVVCNEYRKPQTSKMYLCAWTFPVHNSTGFTHMLLPWSPVPWWLQNSLMTMFQEKGRPSFRLVLVSLEKTQ